MLTVLLLESLLQSFTGREDDFTFSLIKALSRCLINVFSSLDDAEAMCGQREVLAHPNGTSTDLVEDLYVSGLIA